VIRIGDDRQETTWTREAEFYTSDGVRVRCTKCPNLCVISEGDLGVCRNRWNHGGRLIALGYGSPCAVHVDPIEKKPFYHFLPSTRAFSIAVAGCNLRCLNCQNWEISQVSPRETSNYSLPPPRAVEEAAGSDCRSIAYTYSEPTTFYEYVLDTGAAARARGIRNLLKSNGYINERPLRRLCGVLDAANIDLKAYDDGLYRKLSGGRLEPVLRSIRVLREEGVWVEVTNLVIPGWTDDLSMIGRMCDWMAQNGLEGVPLHFTRFSPLYRLTHLPSTPVSILEKARGIALASGVRFAYVGNVPGHPMESTFCPRCGKEIVTRKGFTITKNRVEGGCCGYCREPIGGDWP
jgi:pyruvate formate lyase activating enzyme